MRTLLLLVWAALWIISCGPKPTGEIMISESAILYESPSSNARILDTIPAGTVVSRLAQEGEWTWVCLRGLKGWIAATPLATNLTTEPLPESILAEKRSDTVLAEIGIDNEKNIYLRLTDFQPWFTSDSIQYAGFYEGLPGEPFALLIVNFAPKLALILRTTEIETETMDLQEADYVLSGDYRLLGNLILPTESAGELPFKRAEFISYQGRKAILIEQVPGTYRLLWRREFVS